MIGQRRVACSFCGRGEAAVDKLVAGPRLMFLGPRVHICDQCVGAAQQIMEQPESGGPPCPPERVGVLKRVLGRFTHSRRGASRGSARNAAVLHV
jgi:hypothetical protein